MGLVGREAQLQAIDALLAGVAAHGGALLLRGEAGIGKSSILAEAGKRARGQGMVVLGAVGVQSEAKLPFAGLHQLLRPSLGDTERLPSRQHEALQAAFGLTDEAAPDPFLIGLATLNVLSDVASTSPVLVLIDDAQWLDAATTDALLFVARRIASDPVVVLAATRDGIGSRFDQAGWPEIHIHPLDDASSRELIEKEAPDLTPTMRRRVLEEAAGNPLAIVELPIALRSRAFAGGRQQSDLMPLTARLERAFAARAANLPEPSRRMLLVAALNDGDAVSEILDAAGLLEGTTVGPALLEPAMTERLIDLDDRVVRFRHPLVRSAIVQGAATAERLAGHAALAEVLADQPDRAAWQLAASTIGHDEHVAAELEGVAERALRRGATAVALTALERAALLADDQARRGDRLLRAAELAYEIGRFDALERLLAEAEPLESGPGQPPRLAWLRAYQTWSGDERIGDIIDSADRMRIEGEPERALSSILTVALRLWWSPPAPEIGRRIIEAAEGSAPSTDDPELISVIAFAGASSLRAADVVEQLSRLSPDVGGEPEDLRLLGTAATAVGAFDRAEPFLEAAVAGLRTQGRLGLLTYAQTSRAWTCLFTGEWAIGRSAGEEAARLATETNQPVWLLAAKAADASMAALLGDVPTASALIAEAESVFLPLGAGPILGLAQIARGITSLATGHYADAFDQISRLFDPSDPAFIRHVRPWVLAELVESAIHSGHDIDARAAVDELEAVARVTRSPLLIAVLHYARPLVASEAQAEKLFKSGINADLTAWPFLRGRLLLSYGEWLRRHRRIAESRAPLRSARDAMDHLGAAAWAERARHELRAAGETSSQRERSAVDALTPQELQIAQMAAEGMSNGEIGERLYISHRTVGSHLYHVYPKLGVTSRAQLQRVFGSISNDSRDRGGT